jgi:hypothetical protein
VDLVVHQVVQLQQVLHAHGHRTRELLARAAVEQVDWPDWSKPARTSASFTSASLAPSKTGVAIGTPRVTLPAAREADPRHAADALVVDLVAIGDLHRVAHRGQIARAAIFVQRVVDLEAQAARGPAHVGLEDLADVHPARHAERVQTKSTGVPSARNGMSSIGTTLEMTPLLP